MENVITVLSFVAGKGVGMLLPVCVWALCISGTDCEGKTSLDVGVLRAFPSPCMVTEYSLVLYERREKPVYGKEDGFCVVREPVKAVFPEKICDALDEIMRGEPRSLVLLGQGGTGKSLFMELVSRIAPFNVIWMNAEELLSKWVGESEQNLRSILASCEESEPCIILADEADIILMKRSAGGMMHGIGTAHVEANMIRILLRTLQRWYNEKRRLAMIATSNMPAEAIDKPMLRAGRLGEPIYFPIPDRKAVYKLAELYGKEVTEEIVEEILRYGLPHSNVVEYLVKGKLQKWSPESYAGIEYALVKRKPRIKLGLGTNSRLVIAEPWPLGVRLASLITAIEYGKSVVYLKDPSKMLDLYFMGQTMEAALAIPYTPPTSIADIVFYDYPYPVFFIGREWNLPFPRLALEHIMQTYSPLVVVEAICRGKRGARALTKTQAERMVQECISGIEPG